MRHQPQGHAVHIFGRRWWICARTGGGHVMDTPPIVSPQEWEAAREQLLVKEKELTRARDALAAERRRMPWLAVEKEYVFDGPERSEERRVGKECGGRWGG